MTTSPLPHLPYGRQDVDEADIAAVVAALKGDWLTSGPAVDVFEQALADMVKAPYAIACSSGTAALHLAALALDLGPSDMAIVPALTFAATANAVRYVGAEVVFCDVDPETGLATAETVEAAIDRAGTRAKAVFVVHLNGQAVNVAAVGDLARAQGLAVVEDACHAIGGTSRTHAGGEAKIGACSEGDLTIFSFHPVKTVTTTEGGAITCRCASTAERLKRLRNHGITREPTAFSVSDQAFDEQGGANPWYYEIAELGFNYRVSDVQCALGSSQLKRLAQFVARRADLAACYDRLLGSLAPWVRPIRRTGDGKPAWHLYPVLIDFAGIGRSRAAVMNELREHGVGTQVHYLPVSRQPYYVARYGEISLPGADAYYDRCLSLPLYPAMAEADVHRVVEALSNVVRRG